MPFQTGNGTDSEPQIGFPSGVDHFLLRHKSKINRVNTGDALAVQHGRFKPPLLRGLNRFTSPILGRASERVRFHNSTFSVDPASTVTVVGTSIGGAREACLSGMIFLRGRAGTGTSTGTMEGAPNPSLS